MKTTYLVYKQVDGVRQLVAATQEEWDAIMKGNRGLPMGQRRCFMKDCFEDGDELDCMYIETTAAEYREWNSENTIAQRKRKVGSSDHLLIDELKTALRKWKPWAEELLELYLSGAKRSCTNSLCEKYRLSDRAIQKRKTAFEKFVLDFLKK